MYVLHSLVFELQTFNENIQSVRLVPQHALLNVEFCTRSKTILSKIKAEFTQFHFERTPRMIH